MAENSSEINSPHNADHETPHYDITVASQTYSNIATVLAGFAFAAVVLVVQESNVAPDQQFLQQRATIAFLVSFLGCIVTAFLFAVIGGESKHVPRSNTIALIGAAGLALSTVYVVWGLGTLINVFLGREIASLAIYILLAIVFLAPYYLVLFVADPIIRFDLFGSEHNRVRRKILIRLFLVTYSPILVAGILKWIFRIQISPILSSVFSLTVLLSIILLTIGNAWALLVSNREAEYVVSLQMSMVWMLLHTLIMAILLLLFPF